MLGTHRPPVISRASSAAHRIQLGVHLALISAVLIQSRSFCRAKISQSHCRRQQMPARSSIHLRRRLPVESSRRLRARVAWRSRQVPISASMPATPSICDQSPPGCVQHESVIVRFDARGDHAAHKQRALDLSRSLQPANQFENAAAMPPARRSFPASPGRSRLVSSPRQCSMQR